MRKRVFLLIVLLLAACQSLSPTPSPEQMEKGDFGPRPDNVQEVITPYLQRILFDPGSVSQFAVTSGPEQCGKKCGLGTPVFGWCTSVEYNAKNRMGGYVGLTQHNYMLHYGKVIFADGLFTENLSCGR